MPFPFVFEHDSQMALDGGKAPSLHGLCTTFFCRSETESFRRLLCGRRTVPELIELYPGRDCAAVTQGLIDPGEQCRVDHAEIIG